MREMPDLSGLEDKWRRARNQEYRIAVRKEQLKKLDNEKVLKINFLKKNKNKKIIQKNKYYINNI